VTLGEVLATSDVPAGVINILTGLRKELVPTLAAAHGRQRARHMGRAAPTCAPRLRRLLSKTSNAVTRPPRGVDDRYDWLDDRRAQRPEWIAAYLEIKTVWHPIGM